MNRLQRSINFEVRVWKNDLWTEKLETLDTQDSSLWKMTKQLMRVQDPTPPLRTAASLALSDSDKAEALADSLEAQFQPVPIDPTRPPEVALIDETELISQDEGTAVNHPTPISATFPARPVVLTGTTLKPARTILSATNVADIRTSAPTG
ncbi:hypothetical protein C0J52_15506 [Blattella germanica]|nr:hypothetical protein C0J52_15506 [Blattella germanica]